MPYKSLNAIIVDSLNAWIRLKTKHWKKHDITILVPVHFILSAWNPHSLPKGEKKHDTLTKEALEGLISPSSINHSPSTQGLIITVSWQTLMYGKRYTFFLWFLCVLPNPYILSTLRYCLYTVGHLFRQIPAVFSTKSPCISSVRWPEVPCHCILWSSSFLCRPWFLHQPLHPVAQRSKRRNIAIFSAS